MVPLTAGARPVDHAVQAPALVGARAAYLAGWVKFSEQRQEQFLPQGLGDFPDRGQRLARRDLIFRLAHASSIGRSRLLG